MHRIGAIVSVPDSVYLKLSRLFGLFGRSASTGGLYGAKITSSGSTVAVLCHGDVSNAMIQILSAYKLAWGLDAEVFAGSSPGAFEFGHVILRLSKE